MERLRTRATNPFRLLLRQEEGIALVLALAMTVSLGIMVATAMYYTTASAHGASRSHFDVKTTALAEAGLNNAFSTLYAAQDPTMPGAVPQQLRVPLGDGYVTWFGTLDQSTKVWTLTGTAYMRNPTGGAEIVKTVTGSAHLGTSTHGSANNAVWNYVYADDLTTCTTLANSVNISVPLYVRGNLCLTNSAQVSGAYALNVGGTVTISNSAHVGSSSVPLANIHIGGGCSVNGGTSYDSPCGPADRVYGTVVDNQPAGLTKPPVDLPGWYLNALPGPRHGCTSGSFPGGFDNDATMNASLGTVNLTPATAYDCQVRDVSGNLLGRIAWTPGSPGLLTVAGTIFIDGSVAFSNSTRVVYQGSATLYLAGTFKLANSSSLCGTTNCDASWDANQNLLAIVAGSLDGAQTSIDFANSSSFQGALYAVNDYREANSVTTWGPIIARQLYFQNSTITHYVPIGTPLPGMPATYDTAVTITNDAGSWTG